MSRVTDHTRTEKIGGDSIVFILWSIQVVAENRYDNQQNKKLKKKLYMIFVITVSRHDLDDPKKLMESPPIFSVRV